VKHSPAINRDRHHDTHRPRTPDTSFFNRRQSPNVRTFHVSLR
jgi:hypothetical protein